jgi:hypothetical protein
MKSGAILSVLTWEVLVGNKHAAATGISQGRGVLYLVDIGILIESVSRSGQGMGDSIPHF